MTSYQQLTQEQRYQIYALMKANFTLTQIASEIGVHKSTVAREVRRNRGGRGYRPKQAQQLTTARKLAASTTRISAVTWRLVERRLRNEQWSPEQISGWLRLTHQPSVSPERIYQYVYADKRAGGTLSTHLRCQKQRRKRYGSYDRRGRLPNCRSIEERPAVVDAKRRLGDWEADTIIGKNHQGAIVTLTERKSKLLLMQKVRDKSAAGVAQAMLTLLGAVVADQVHTITSDNGREFAHHQVIAEQLRADFYFAHPSSSWERGLNENTNGLVRQYFPKHCDFTKITDEEVKEVEHRLNSRPRKTLSYQTPQQVFYKQPSVALQC
jgi:IS30 family transposase